MTEIEVRTDGNKLSTATGIVQRFARNELPVMTKVRVSHIQRALEEVAIPWSQRMLPKIREYTTDEKHKDGLDRIEKSHPRYEEFEADEEVQELEGEELVVHIRPLLLSELQAAEERIERRPDRPTMWLPTSGLALLLEMGIVRDDLSKEDSEEESPEPQPAKKKRAKAKE